MYKSFEEMSIAFVACEQAKFILRSADVCRLSSDCDNGAVCDHPASWLFGSTRNKVRGDIRKLTLLRSSHTGIHASQRLFDQ